MRRSAADLLAIAVVCLIGVFLILIGALLVFDEPPTPITQPINATPIMRAPTVEPTPTPTIPVSVPIGPTDAEAGHPYQSCLLRADNLCPESAHDLRASKQVTP